MKIFSGPLFVLTLFHACYLHLYVMDLLTFRDARQAAGKAGFTKLYVLVSFGLHKEGVHLLLLEGSLRALVMCYPQG